ANCAAMAGALDAGGAALTIDNADSLAAAVSRLLTDPRERAARAKAAARIAAASSGTLDAVLARCAPWLDPLAAIGAPMEPAAVPVVCVGNLVAGGSGKTPVVLSLAAMAADNGLAVHVVTRGYGGRLVGPVRVDPTLHDAALVGDEALLIAVRAPCWVARNRR